MRQEETLRTSAMLNNLIEDLEAVILEGEFNVHDLNEWLETLQAAVCNVRKMEDRLADMYI